MIPLALFLLLATLLVMLGIKQLVRIRRGDAPAPDRRHDPNCGGFCQSRLELASDTRLALAVACGDGGLTFGEINRWLEEATGLYVSSSQTGTVIGGLRNSAMLEGRIVGSEWMYVIGPVTRLLTGEPAGVAS